MILVILAWLTSQYTHRHILIWKNKNTIQRNSCRSTLGCSTKMKKKKKKEKEERKTHWLVWYTYLYDIPQAVLEHTHTLTIATRSFCIINVWFAAAATATTAAAAIDCILSHLGTHTFIALFLLVLSCLALSFLYLCLSLSVETKLLLSLSVCIIVGISFELRFRRFFSSSPFTR